jgi:hypothetical protein
LGAGSVATIAKGLGSQITDVGVKGRCTLLSCEDEEMHVNATIDAYLEQFDKASDSCASKGRLYG